MEVCIVLVHMGLDSKEEKVEKGEEECLVVKEGQGLVQWVAASFVAAHGRFESEWQPVVTLQPYYLRAWLLLQQLEPTECQGRP